MPSPSEEYAVRARGFAASKKRIQYLRAFTEALIAETGMDIAQSWQIAREIDREISRQNATAARDDFGGGVRDCEIASAKSFGRGARRQE